MSDSAKRLLEIHEMVEQIPPMLKVMTLLPKICSVVLRPGVESTCSSAGNTSALVLGRLRITRGMILLGWLIKLLVRLLDIA